VHSPGGNTFLREMTDLDKFHPDLILNDRALGFFRKRMPQQEEQQRQEQDE